MIIFGLNNYILIVTILSFYQIMNKGFIEIVVRDLSYMNYMSVNNTIYFTQYIGFYIIHIKGTDHEYIFMLKILAVKNILSPNTLCIWVFNFYVP